MDRLRPAETPEPCPFGSADAYREVVKTLRELLEAEDIAAAKPLLRDLIGPITAVPTESDGERYLKAHFPAFSMEGRLVAGAGYQRYLALVTALQQRFAGRWPVGPPSRQRADRELYNSLHDWEID